MAEGHFMRALAPDAAATVNFRPPALWAVTVNFQRPARWVATPRGNAPQPRAGGAFRFDMASTSSTSAPPGAAAGTDHNTAQEGVFRFDVASGSSTSEVSAAANAGDCLVEQHARA